MSCFSKISGTSYPLCLQGYIPQRASEQESEDSLPKEHVKIGGKTYYKIDNCKLRLKFLQLSLTDPVTQPFMATPVIIAEIAMGILNGLLFIVSHDPRQFCECIRLIAHAGTIPFALIALEATAIFGVLVTPHYARHLYTKIEGYIYGQFIPEQGAFFKFTSNIFDPAQKVDDYQRYLDLPKLTQADTGLWYFLKQACTNPDQTASLVPSSRALALEITSFMDQWSASTPPKRILEIGAGSGAFTREVLRKLRPQDQFDVVELDPGFCEILRDLCAGRENVRVHEVSILTFEAEKYDLIVSGLPLHALGSVSFIEEVHNKFLTLAKEEGEIAQFDYIALPRLGSWVFCGEKRQNLIEIMQSKERFLQAHPTTTNSVYWNFPPARVVHTRPA